MKVKTRSKFPCKLTAPVRITQEMRNWLNEVIEEQPEVTDSDIVRDALELYRAKSKKVSKEKVS